MDGNLSPQQALDRLEELGMPMPNIIYRTLTDPTDPNLHTNNKLRQVKKYRLIFALDNTIYDIQEYEFLLKKGMYLIFPEADHVGATQKWLGGKEVIYLNTKSRLSPLNLMCCVDIYNARNVKTSHG